MSQDMGFRYKQNQSRQFQYPQSLRLHYLYPGNLLLSKLHLKFLASRLLLFSPLCLLTQRPVFLCLTPVYQHHSALDLSVLPSKIPFCPSLLRYSLLPANFLKFPLRPVPVPFSVFHLLLFQLQILLRQEYFLQP